MQPATNQVQPENVEEFAGTSLRQGPKPCSVAAPPSTHRGAQGDRCGHRSLRAIAVACCLAAIHCRYAAALLAWGPDMLQGPCFGPKGWLLLRKPRAAIEQCWRRALGCEEQGENPAASLAAARGCTRGWTQILAAPTTKERNGATSSSRCQRGVLASLRTDKPLPLQEATVRTHSHRGIPEAPTDTHSSPLAGDTPIAPPSGPQQPEAASSGPAASTPPSPRRNSRRREPRRAPQSQPPPSNSLSPWRPPQLQQRHQQLMIGRRSSRCPPKTPATRRRWASF